MNRILITGILMALAAVAGYLVATGQRSDSRPQGPRVAEIDPTRSVDVMPPPAPTISTEEALDHRATHYQKLDDIDGVLELPTDFAQTEALYTLAGRANAVELEQLIVESTHIAHRYDRRAALDILFSRYAELDPLAALNYLLQMDLDIDDLVLPSLMSAWAKQDPAAAIAAANQMTNVRLRKLAGNTILTVAARNDPGTLQTVASKLIDHHDTKWIESEMIGVQANYQPVVALEQALRQSRYSRGRNAVYRVGEVWARHDPEAALAYAATIPDIKQRQDFIRAVTGRWMADDPKGAMQSLLALPEGTQRTRILTRALTGYAESHPEDAVRVARSMGSAAGEQALQGVYMSWAQSDPDGALNAISADGMSAGQTNTINSVLSVVAGSDPEKAWRFAQSLDAMQQMEVIPGILSQLSQREPQRALELALAIERPEQREQGLHVVIRQLAHSKPLLAAQYLDQLPNSAMTNILISEIAAEQSYSNPAAAIAWANTLSGSAYENALMGIGPAIAMNDPDLAASMMDQVRGEARATWLGSITNAYARTDPMRALAFASRYADMPGYSMAVSQAVVSLAQTDPQAALQVAGDLDAATRAQVTGRTLSRWARRDPRAAAQWAQRSDPDVRFNAITAVTNQWANQDPDAAERWAMTLRNDDRDRALMGLMGVSSLSTADRVRVANAIRSEQQREQSAASIYLAARMRNGQQAANEMLDQLNISTATRERLRASGN